MRQTIEQQATTGGGDAEDLFRPAAARYRARLGKFVACLIAGAFLVGVSLLVPEAALPWFAVPGSALIAFGLLLFFTVPRLACPACHKVVDAPGPHCPVCGSIEIQPASLARPRTCGSCGARLGGYKYRAFRIHYCQHCGTLVSRAGV